MSLANQISNLNKWVIIPDYGCLFIDLGGIAFSWMERLFLGENDRCIDLGIILAVFSDSKFQ